MTIKFYKQRDNVDCGPTCLKIIAQYYGKNISIEFLRNITFLTKEGTSLGAIKNASDFLGFESLSVDISIESLIENGVLPCILYWKKNHFVVLYKIKESSPLFSGSKKRKYFIADPAHGKVILSENDFVAFWESINGSKRGFALFLEPTDSFHQLIFSESKHKIKVVGFMFNYFKKFKNNYLQVSFAMVATMLTSMILPFLTQNIIDTGIVQKDINFITILLIFQIGLFLSNTLVETIRSHLLLHISSRVNILIIADYLKQLLALPVGFFESKLISDLVQRVNDNRRIEDFITSTLINTFFSIINLIIFSIILFFFSTNAFIIFLTSSIISILWISFFMEKKRQLDYRRFNNLSNSGEHIYEMLGNINEVKLNSYEEQMRKEWEKKQYTTFLTSIENLKIEQYQQIGTDFFDQLKNILITFISAYSVINNVMTLGTMLSISYILSQVNSPIKQLIAFIKNAQSASIGIERLSEVFFEDTEERSGQLIYQGNEDKYGIHLNNVSFQYGPKFSPFVLKNIDLTIPYGKVTAIVGASGSGKTTLIKLLLKLHSPTSGEILINKINLGELSSKSWREQCGTVMQEGHIFNDSIQKNITMADENVDQKKLEQAIHISNLKDIIDNMPLGLDTRLSINGIKLSSGQKQRLLIARAIYKSPKFIFFDEATNSLDAKNERQIVERLNSFFQHKTVIIVAHRLSTVKNADKIVVLDKGMVVETGVHRELVMKKGYYFNLIKNQLELDT